MSEVDKVRHAYALDPSISNEDYVRLIDEADQADQAREYEAEKPEDEPEARFWLNWDKDPQGMPYGIVDEHDGGSIAYAHNESLGDFIVDALNRLHDLGLLGSLPDLLGPLPDNKETT